MEEQNISQGERAVQGLLKLIQDGDYTPGEKLPTEPELAKEKEKGERCRRCDEFRLKKAYEYAKVQDFDYFCTTLSISPFKDAEKINKAKKKEINVLQKQASIDVAERDKIVGLIDIKTEEKYKTEAQIDRFNFYSQDAAETRNLIETIDTQLQSLNAERYRLGYEIKKINTSLEQTAVTVRLDKLKELYNEVELFFPDELSKQYEDLERFTDAISTERRKYLEHNLASLKEEFASLSEVIKAKEQERSERISLLTEADVYDKFKHYQKELSSLEAELAMLPEKLRLIDSSS